MTETSSSGAVWLEEQMEQQMFQELGRFEQEHETPHSQVCGQETTPDLRAVVTMGRK